MAHSALKVSKQASKTFKFIFLRSFTSQINATSGQLFSTWPVHLYSSASQRNGASVHLFIQQCVQAYAEEKGFFQKYSEREQEMLIRSTTSTTFQIFLNAKMNILSSLDKSRCFESILHSGDFTSFSVYKVSLSIPLSFPAIFTW